jgi:hypothetical protein
VKDRVSANLQKKEKKTYTPTVECSMFVEVEYCSRQYRSTYPHQSQILAKVLLRVIFTFINSRQPVTWARLNSLSI